MTNQNSINIVEKIRKTVVELVEYRVSCVKEILFIFGSTRLKPSNYFIFIDDIDSQSNVLVR